jgi:hypothetical protein
MLNVVLPWRYFAGESLRAGIVPLWNPYQQCGYPIHADLQYPIWYPEVFIIGGLFGYTNVTLHFLFILYVILAGFGMFHLAREFQINYHYALLSGVAYMLCGIFVGYSQSLASILGATWLPWVLAYYLRLLRGSNDLLSVFKLSLFLFLMISGGYQALSFMLFYVMLVLFLYTIGKEMVFRNFHSIRRLLISHLELLGIILPLCLGIALSLYYVFPYIERLSGLSSMAAEKFAFTPQSLISLILPFSAIKEKGFFLTDFSMTNAFMGVIMLIGAILGLVKRKPGELHILIVFGLLFLLASFGKYTPVQSWLFAYVPFLNLFKYPCFYRFFTMIAFIMSAGYYFTHYCSKENRKELRIFRAVTGFFIVTYIFLFAFSLSKISFTQLSYFQGDKNIFQALKESTIYENIFIQSFIQSLVIGLFFVFSLRKKANLNRLIFGISVVELVMAAQLNGPITTYCNLKPAIIREDVRHYPKGFPIPDNLAVAQNSDRKHFENILYLNLGSFTKQVSSDAFTSFLFKGWETLIDSFPALRDSMFSNPVLYLSDDIRPLSKIGERDFGSKTLYIEDSLFQKYGGAPNKPVDEEVPKINLFTPQEIQCAINLREQHWLTLQQNNYVGWSVYIDDNKVPHCTSNLSYISLLVPPGQHTIKFNYSMPVITWAFWLSMFLFLLLLLLILYYQLKSYGKHRAIYLTSLTAVAIILLFTVKKITIGAALREQNDRITSVLKQAVESKLNAEGFVISTDDINKLPEKFRSGDSSIFICNTFRSDEFKNLLSYLEDKSPENLCYIDINTREKVNVLGALHHMYRHDSVILHSQACDFVLYKKNKTGERIEQTYTTEETNTIWHVGGRADSTTYFSPPASIYLDSIEVYPAGLKITRNKIPLPGEQILSFNCKVRWKKAGEVFAVFQINRKRQIIYYKAVSMLDYRTINKWNTFSYSIWLGNCFQKNDRISVYIWKPGDAMCWIDNIEVTAFPVNKVNQ